MTTWRQEILQQMEKDGEHPISLICTLTDAQLDTKFDSGYGGVNGLPFTAWGERWVYFPLSYDGGEWVGHAPRNPCDIAMEHQGGG